MATVPNSTDFSLQDVVNVVGGTSLSAAFGNANSSCFDSSYIGSQDRLTNFRNYDDSYNDTWLGYITWSMSTYDGTYLYFTATNISSARNAQTSSLYWETQNGGSTVNYGNTSSGSLDASGVSYPTAAHGGGTWDSVWGSTGGALIQLY
jgi:hypothetical protein